jgi:molybdopterin-guanine dinucleotide biosynthesis protein A
VTVEPVQASAIILAGGRASRFGSDKLSVEVDGSPLVHHAFHAAAAICDEVIVVIARDGLEPTLPAGFDVTTRLVRDREVHPGPLAALLAGSRAATSTRLAVVAGDMPDLRVAVLDRLLRWTRGRGACLVAGGEPQVLPLGLDRDTAVEAGERLLASDERSLRALVECLDLELIAEAEWRAVDPDGASLRDIDLPEDLVHRR